MGTTTMQDAQDFRQAVCESRKSDHVIKFITADHFTPLIQALMNNGNVWGAYYERNGRLVVEDCWGKKHRNVLGAGHPTHAIFERGEFRRFSFRTAQDQMDYGTPDFKWVALSPRQRAKLVLDLDNCYNAGARLNGHACRIFLS